MVKGNLHTAVAGYKSVGKSAGSCLIKGLHLNVVGARIEWGERFEFT